jgi:hypothetical protein
MPGWTGNQCQFPIAGALSVPGWCVPKTTWWNTTDAAARDAGGAVDSGARDPSVCNGHGHCMARTSEADITRLRYTFCQCDEGWYGEGCQTQSLPTDTYGDYYNYAFTAKDKLLCNVGAIPAIVRTFFQVTFPSARCSSHGFGVRFPGTSGDPTKLAYSNVFRVQTPAACFCEPGYNGEECLGGQPVPDSQGWVHGACSAVLLFIVALLYRDRKRMQRGFDTEVLTARDFTVFVNHLPTTKLENIGDVYAHFSQFGPVHFISPANSDDRLVLLQREKNTVLTAIQVFQENDTYLRKLEAWKRAVEAAKASGDKEALKALPKPEPASVPRLTDAAEPDEGMANMPTAEIDFQLWVSYSTLGPSVRSRGFYFRYLMNLNSAIRREMEQAHVRSFSRAFVTFKTTDARDRCLTLYSERRDGMFGKLPEYDPRIIYQNKHFISVSAAPEPEEVQWQSLAVGPRVRGLLVSVSVIAMIGIIAGMFNLVLVINETKATGVVGLLVSLALLVLNVVVAQVWLSTADFESHYYTGASMRSVYLKTLITQIFITLLAGTIGVYGYPIDSKNGYVQDWYKEAGGFVFRMVLIESIVPPVVDFLALDKRMNGYFASVSMSATQKKMFEAPPVGILAMRSAALMRTVIMCCAFNAGLPVLNFAVAAGLFIRYQSDKYLYQNYFAVRKSGPELARAIELTLMFAATVHVVMGWVTLRLGWASNLITEAIFYIGIIGVMWAVLGYFSYRWFRGRDCWCGSGPLVPCIGWLVCFSERFLGPFHYVHEAFMVLIFGVSFFATIEEKRRGGEQGGLTYEVAMRTKGLRRIPYYIAERGQIFNGLVSDEPLPVPRNGRETLAAIEQERMKKRGGTDVEMTMSPLLERQKMERMKLAAAVQASNLGLDSSALLEGTGAGAGAGAATTTTGAGGATTVNPMRSAAVAGADKGAGTAAALGAAPPPPPPPPPAVAGKAAWQPTSR